jgi:hypothetical protein
MSETKRCPYCGEEIMAAAKKCKYCGEWLVKDVPDDVVPPAPQEQKPTPAITKDATPFFLFAFGWFLLVVVLPIAVVLFVAHVTVPSQEKHVAAIMEEVRSCVRDKAEDSGNAVIPGLGSLASLFLSNSLTDDVVDKAFDNNNKIEYDESLFWSCGKIVNASHPMGVTVSFGIFGFVFPSVDWEDIRLMSDEQKESIINSATDDSSGTDEESSGVDNSSEDDTYNEDNTSVDDEQTSASRSSETKKTPERIAAPEVENTPKQEEETAPEAPNKGTGFHLEPVNK